MSPHRSRRRVNKDLIPKSKQQQKKQKRSATERKRAAASVSKKKGTRAAHSSQLVKKKKIIGVRRLLSREGDEEDLIEDPRAYEHGIDNPIISSLIKSNPQLLGCALSTRNPVAATQSDYILSLLTSQGRDNVRRDSSSRRRSAASAAALSSSSVQQKGGTIGSAGRKRKARDKTLGSLGVEDAHPSHKRVFAARFMDQDDSSLYVGEVEEDDLGIVTRDDEPYLKDYLEECGAEARTTATGTAGVKRSSDSLSGDYSVEDLTWLTQEMERDYKLFLAFTKDESADGDFDIDAEAKEDTKAAGKAKYRYKATMNLTRGAGHCALGIFRTAEEAAVAYDRHAIGRRTLGKKILEEFRLRRAVKVRKAAHLETKRALEVDRVTPEVAAKRSHAAAIHVFDSVTTDAYLSSSQTVMRPDLNSDGALEFFELEETDEAELIAIDDERVARARANREELDRISSAMLHSGKALVALQMCLDVITEETVIADEPESTESNLLDADVGSQLAVKIHKLNSEYGDLTESLLNRGDEISRLIKIEESMIPLKREEYYCTSKLSTSFLADMMETENENKVEDE